MDSASSAFLLNMYQAARRMPHADFRPWVFANLGRYLRFDSGFWLRTVVTPDGPQMHDQFLDRQWPDRVSGYLAQELWREDPFLQSILSSRNTTLMMSVESVPAGRLRAFLRQREQEHVVAATEVDAIAGVVTGISVFRRDPADPFEEADRQFLEGVRPHIIEAWTHNWLQELGAGDAGRAAPDAGTAVLTAQHVITVTDDHFALMMNREWPAWRGPLLPEPLDAHLRQRPGEAWSGHSVVVRFQELHDGPIVVRLRARHALDELSPRKREVARRFAGGASQAEVAEQMALSSSTVNNYLVEIYRQLNVSDKAQLAVIVARLQLD